MSGCKFLIMGGQREKFEPAYLSGAGVVCLDLEDTVADADKDAVRESVPEFLAMGKHINCERSVRISSLSTADGLKDILMLQQLAEPPQSLLLAKVGSAAEVVLVKQLLSARFAELPLQVIVETAEALANVDEIAMVPGVTALVFGGKDLSSALRIERSWEPLLYARSRCVAAASLRQINIYDEPYSPRDDLEGLAAAARRAKALGFTGKSAVDLRHVSVINEVFM